MPPSTDRPTVLRAVDGIELQDGTALGGAIDKSLEAVKMAPGGLKIRLRPPLSCSVMGIIPKAVLPGGGQPSCRGQSPGVHHRLWYRDRVCRP